MTRTSSDQALKSYSQLFVGGRWVPSHGDRKLEVISPVTEQVLATVPDAVDADADAAVAAAREAFDSGPWPRMAPQERAAIMARARDEVSLRLEAMTEAFTAEVGVPLGGSRGSHEAAVAMWDEAIALHNRFAFEQDREWSSGSGRLVWEPVGVVAAIAPWNAPVFTASMKAAAALAAGCTVVLKAAPEGAVSVMLFAEALEAAGLPEGVISVLPGGRDVGEHLVRHPDVDKVTFTGSTAAGKRIMSLCGERIARVTLELGGKSAAIIADDVDLGDHLRALALEGVRHSGQICSAITRILVPRGRQAEVVDALVEIYESLKVGDPTEPDTAIGPLVSARQHERVQSYIALGESEGARLVTGGRRPAGLPSGWFVEPTLFADVRNDMRIAREEIFGPVVCVIPFDSVDDAIAIANDSPYGLAGAVYARDQGLAESIARRIRAGQVSINKAATTTEAPFGGFKQSGIGREGDVEGLGSYLEAKLIIGHSR